MLRPLLVLAFLLAAWACAAPRAAAPETVQSDEPSVQSGGERRPAPEDLSGRPAETIRHTPLGGDWRVAIPAIGVDASIVAVGLEPDGSMGAPDEPDVVGWYRHGPAPGERGNVLLDGHVDWTNRQTGVPFFGVFWYLKNLNPGARVIVSDGAQEWVYEVTEKKRYRYDDPAGISVLQPADDSRLTMITCGGNFNRATRTYDTREIVIARLVG